MKRPSKQRVIKAIKRDFPMGKVEFIEAVELDSGVMVVEYMVTSKYPKFKEAHVTRRIVTVDPRERIRSSVIVESWFDKK